MKIVLVNDDGYNAPGIRILKEELQNNGHDIIIIAPDKERSANSHMITLHEPLRIHQHSEDVFAITGTPADCMIIASETILKGKKIDLVISGINGGQNLGEDVLYSGTVAAALEANFLGYKSVAISLTSYENQKFETAAKVISQLIDYGLIENLKGREILNINVPNITYDELQGIKITRIGRRRYLDFVLESKDQRNRDIYWIGGNEVEWDYDESCDAFAVQNNFVSVTPVAFNFTNVESFDRLEHWFSGFKL